MSETPKPLQVGNPKPQIAAGRKRTGDNDGQSIVVTTVRKRADRGKPEQAERSGGLVESADGASRNYLTT